MPGRLESRIALVTGSSSGLGRAISLAFAKEGAKICCVDLHEKPRNWTNKTTGKADDWNNRIEGESTVEEIIRSYGGGDEERAIYIRADLTVANEVEEAVRRCVQFFGRLDILSNNAGISLESTHPLPLPLHLTPEADFDKTWEINTKTVFLTCKSSLAQFLSQEQLYDSKGWIINTASIQAIVAYHHTPSYCASKSAVSGLTRQIALDYAPHKIHSNALCPGFLKTAMTQNLQNDPRKFDEINKAHPLKGMGNVEDVARAAVFLASDDVGWITGVNLPVDGGYSIM